ncbi:MAG TPA: cytochrome c biogenesis protein CcsA [Burkholderiales bacterium]|nr:cytochrome c biogenesis protein CcsA [Burkholderiales bacterium]
MPELFFYSITALLYLGLAVSAWRRMPEQSASSTLAVFESSAVLQRGLLPLALAIHAYLLIHDMLGGRGFNLNLGAALSLIVWLTVLIYWVESYWVQVGALRTFILPVAAISVLLPYFMDAQHVLTYANMSLFKSHLAISMLAYGLLTVAALHALLMSVLEKRLHKGNLPALLRDLPPLMVLERLTFRILFAGFVLLTLTLLSGVFFSEALFGKPMQFTHKALFGFVAWLIFGLLLIGRHMWGWRGRVAVRWLLSGFGFLVLAYLGSKLVLEVILHRY